MHTIKGKKIQFNNRFFIIVHEFEGCIGVILQGKDGLYTAYKDDKSPTGYTIPKKSLTQRSWFEPEANYRW